VRGLPRRHVDRRLAVPVQIQVIAAQSFTSASLRTPAGSDVASEIARGGAGPRLKVSEARRRVNAGGGVADMTLELTSPAFSEGGTIPRQHTCEGRDVSPALAWSGAPEKTRSFALIVDDPDAPDPQAPKMTWVHWVLYDIPVGTGGLPEAAGLKPQGGHDGTNDWKRTGYGGPCPPIGRHRYFFKLYALDTVLGDQGPLTKAQLEKVLSGHTLAHAQLMGTYQKAGK
jgi:Raf kinase inhibitor-like YbhB/YbcL family protein